MFKSWIIATIFCFSITLNAMQPQAIENEQKNWFLYLPDEICNLIASYLTFDDIETEEEFIERSKVPQDIPSNYHELINPNVYDLPSLDQGCSCHETLVALCPNNIQLISLELLSNHNRLSVVDLKSKQIIQQDLRQENERNGLSVSPDDYKKVAVSHNADAFAILKRTKHIIGKYYEAEIIIRKIDEKINYAQQQIEQLPRMIQFTEKHPIIAFNKPASHIILHTTEDKAVIFPITLAIFKTPSDKKTLKHYFFKNDIYIKDWNCKKIEPIN